MIPSDRVLQWRKEIRPISDITVSKPRAAEIQQAYGRIPSFEMEFGGIMCGKETARGADVTNLVWIPSATASASSFSFHDNIVRNSALYCGGDHILGMFHTHSPDIPRPSRTDLRTSENLHMIGCVVAPQDSAQRQMLNCFRGAKRVNVHYL
jgi:hypothetical protein